MYMLWDRAFGHHAHNKPELSPEQNVGAQESGHFLNQVLLLAQYTLGHTTHLGYLC